MWDAVLSYTVLVYIFTNVTHFYITKSLNSYHMVCIMLSQFKITLPFLDSVHVHFIFKLYRSQRTEYKNVWECSGNPRFLKVNRTRWQFQYLEKKGLFIFQTSRESFCLSEEMSITGPGRQDAGIESTDWHRWAYQIRGSNIRLSPISLITDIRLVPDEDDRDCWCRLCK